MTIAVFSIARFVIPNQTMWSPKPKDIQFTVILNREKQEIFTSELASWHQSMFCIFARRLIQIVY